MRKRGSSTDEIGNELAERRIHPWNLMTLLAQSGIGLGEAREWMRAAGRWPEFIETQDRNDMLLMQALAESDDWEAQWHEDGTISFTSDLRNLDGEELED